MTWPFQGPIAMAPEVQLSWQGFPLRMIRLPGHLLLLVVVVVVERQGPLGPRDRLRGDTIPLPGA